jgi:23S rRNA (adenine2503-C2)-methyltransferase
MPSNRRSGLAELAVALRAYARRPNFVLALNWCLLPGINDRPEDARAAAAFARGQGRALVNLIPYNPGSHPLTRAPTEAEVEGFARLLEAEGCLVKRRAAKGASIMAACGQLGGKKPPPGRPVSGN